MKRRQFATLGVTGTAFLVRPVRSRAQQRAKLPCIGWLWQGRSRGDPQEMTGFRQGLNEFGYTDGKNVSVNYRFAEGESDRIAGLATELMQLQPDVLVAIGATVLRAIQNLTGDVPIVSLSSDPVGMGVVASLARPGGHITGVSMMQGAEGLIGKRIDLLKEALPRAVRLGMLFNPEFSLGDLAQARQAAARRGLALHPIPVRRLEEIRTAIATLADQHVDAVDVEPTSPFISYQPEIAKLLLDLHIPAVSELRLLIESGGLLSYGPNIFDSARRLAYFVDRILKGARPADLPVEQATKLELVVNLKTAKALGIELPTTLLAGADEVIE